MFGIGFLELCVILGVALIFFGPQKLPEMMKHAGRFFVQMRKISSEVKSTMETVVREAEEELRAEEETARKLKAAKIAEAAINVTPPKSETNPAFEQATEKSQKFDSETTPNQLT